MNQAKDHSSPSHPSPLLDSRNLQQNSHNFSSPLLKVSFKNLLKNRFLCARLKSLSIMARTHFIQQDVWLVQMMENHFPHFFCGPRESHLHADPPGPHSRGNNWTEFYTQLCDATNKSISPASSTTPQLPQCIEATLVFQHMWQPRWSSAHVEHDRLRALSFTAVCLWGTEVMAVSRVCWILSEIGLLEGPYVFLHSLVLARKWML